MVAPPKEQKNILVVDDEHHIVQVLSALLRKEGYTVKTAFDAAQALDMMDSDAFDAILSDIRMSGMDGLAFLRESQQRCPETPVVLMTAFASVQTATTGLRDGAYDYISKPFKVSELQSTLRRAVRAKVDTSQNEWTAPTVQYQFESLIAASPEMQEVCRRIEKVALTRHPALILGGPGTGKTAVGRAIHRASRRREAPFLALDCASLGEDRLAEELLGRNDSTDAREQSLPRPGALRSADGGSILLRHVGSLPETLQQILVTYLETGTYTPLGSETPCQSDVRILATDCNELEQVSHAGRFRHDLHTRLHMMTVAVPELRGRQTDIKALTMHFLNQYNQNNDRAVRLSAAAEPALLSHTWPRNVAELEDVIQRAAHNCTGGIIAVSDLPAALRKENASPLNSHSFHASNGRGKTAAAFLRRQESTMIDLLMRRFDGDEAAVAKTLGITPGELRRKLQTSAKPQPASHQG